MTNSFTFSTPKTNTKSPLKCPNAPIKKAKKRLIFTDEQVQSLVDAANSIREAAVQIIDLTNEPDESIGETVTDLTKDEDMGEVNSKEWSAEDKEDKEDKEMLRHLEHKIRSYEYMLRNVAPHNNTMCSSGSNSGSNESSDEEMFRQLEEFKKGTDEGLSYYNDSLASQFPLFTGPPPPGHPYPEAFSHGE